MRLIGPLAILGLAMSACSPEPAPPEDEVVEPLPEVERKEGLDPVPVTLGHRPVVEGTTSASTAETLIYLPHPDHPNDPEAATDLVRVRSERRAKVMEMTDGAVTLIHVEFGDVTVDTKGEYEQENYRSILSGGSYHVVPDTTPLQITRPGGGELEVKEKDELEAIETRLLNVSHFLWLRGQELQPGDQVSLNADMEELFQSLMNTGQAVTGKLTYQGLTDLRGQRVAQVAIGLASMQLSDIGTGQMGMEGQLWVDTETGWVEEVILKGAMAGTPEEGGDVRVRYENRADFTHDHPDDLGQ